MQLVFNIDKKAVATLFGILFLFSIIGIAIAYNSEWQENPGTPSIMGHTLDELAFTLDDLIKKGEIKTAEGYDNISYVNYGGTLTFRKGDMQNQAGVGYPAITTKGGISIRNGSEEGSEGYLLARKLCLSPENGSELPIWDDCISSWAELEGTGLQGVLEKGSSATISEDLMIKNEYPEEKSTKIFTENRTVAPLVHVSAERKDERAGLSVWPNNFSFNFLNTKGASSQELQTIFKMVPNTDSANPKLKIFNNYGPIVVDTPDEHLPQGIYLDEFGNLDVEGDVCNSETCLGGGPDLSGYATKGYVDDKFIILSHARRDSGIQYPNTKEATYYAECPPGYAAMGGGMNYSLKYGSGEIEVFESHASNYDQWRCRLKAGKKIKSMRCYVNCINYTTDLI
jgi:hypothetical protein